MPYIFIKCGQEYKEKAGLFANGESKHCAVRSWKGRPVTFGIKARVSMDSSSGYTLEIRLVIGI